ncbi:PREDICTED: uncharacterized protein LOC109154876 [Ipomoea nil]|uniref:uncharacterized protein LOC109154876 n=1 Tax=Ipomoea nil TaxID=35883 RepID=UPI000900B507|nr:PREDICTED: uncharacterized protein LOC109154876 [Ipomoea nil]
MAEPLPWDFLFLDIKPYMGATDQRDHLNRYKVVMRMTGVNDAIMCRGFCTTLDDQAQDWFESLPAESIPNFAALTKKLMSHFAGSIQRKKQFADLCYLKQLKSETLTEYLSKWKKEAMGVTNFDERSAIPFFINNLRYGPFHSDLVWNESRTYTELMDRAARYANTEAAEKRKEEEEGRRNPSTPCTSSTRSKRGRCGKDRSGGC